MASNVASHGTAERPQFVPRAKVLLVDEDCGDLEYYCSILKQQGYEVHSYRSFAEGVHCLDGEAFDFIVVCQGSLRFEGRSVLEHAMEIDRRTPVLVLTRWHDIGCYLEAMQLGAVDYLEKPLDPLDVARVIETHLRPQHATA